MCKLQYKKNIEPKILSEFLLNLNKKILDNFTYFGKINPKNVNDIVNIELKRKDKIKFFVILDNELIGYSFLTKFVKSEKKHNCTLGIVLDTQFQNKGYGKEICQHMIKSAWQKKMEKIWLVVYEKNKNAIKLYKSLGFIPEGVFYNDEIIKKKKVNVISMALFKNKKINFEKHIKILNDIEKL